MPAVSSMKMSKKGREKLAAEEGVVLRPYKDVAGIWTQGVGHTSRAGEPKVTGSNGPWSREYALFVLEQDLGRTFEPRVRKAIPDANQHEFDGATMFDFNTGAIHSASWVKHFKAGALAEAAKSFKQWVKAGGRTINGLVKRREREWNIIAHGNYGTAAADLLTEPAVLKRGSHDAYGENAVLELQRSLIALGYLAKGGDDGDFGNDTETAVKAFQKDHPHLTVDGRVGPATKAQIQRAEDLRTKATKTSVAGLTGAGAVGAGSSEIEQAKVALEAVGLSPVGVALVVLGVAGFALLIIAWRYQGEIAQAANKLKGA